MPIAGMLATLLLYLVLRRVSEVDESTLARFFAACAVSCYYWYRIPSLLGFGRFFGDGALFDARRVLPAWSPTVLACAAVAFFMYWLLVRPPNEKSWVVRPAYAGRAASTDRG
jgi:hypothetical protein